MAIKAIAIFSITYLLISCKNLNFLRINRTIAAVIGVLLLILSRCINIEQAISFIDFKTIFLLAGMMTFTAALKVAGFFEMVAYRLTLSSKRLEDLLKYLVFATGILSAFFLNDTICLIFTPIIIALSQQVDCDPFPFLIALPLSANIGGVMTLTGNPQNMLVGTFSGIGYLNFLVLMLPIGLGGLLINYYFLRFIFKKKLQANITSNGHSKPHLDGSLAIKSLIILGYTFIGFIMINKLALIAVLGAFALLLISFGDIKKIIRNIDWNLLIFFSGLFIVVGAVNSTGIISLLYSKVAPLVRYYPIGIFSVISAILSNIFSNVPFVIFAREWVAEMPGKEMMWLVLAMSSTLAGNLTIFGSIANLIVIESSKRDYPIGFIQYFKVGIWITFFTLLLGCLVLGIYQVAGVF